MDNGWRKNDSKEKVPLWRRQQQPNGDSRPSFNQYSPKQPFVKTISLKAVEDLHEKQPEQIILEILNPRFGLDSYLTAETMGENLVYKLGQVFLKIYECNSMPTKLSELSTKLLSSKFFNNVLYDSINRQNPLTRSYNERIIRVAVKLITQILFLNPYAIKSISAMRDRLEILIINRIRDHELKELFEDFLIQERNSEDKIEKNKNKTFTNVDSDFSEPSDDFTNLSIVPQFSDIIVADQDVFLRKNITNGSYKSVHHYLDVQFRLLREDFMKPLRDGVCEFRRIVNSSKSNLNREVVQKIKRIEYLNTYFDVYLSRSIAGDHGIVFEMQLNKEKLKTIQWESSRRLMFGSLVCFSSDYFLNECLVGVVCERDASSLQKHGTFNVKFDYAALDKESVQLDKSYVMLETSAFFESYKHVLKALKSFEREGEENFPFKDNLVYCKNRDIPVPSYLKQSCIDFRPLVDDVKKPIINSTTQLNDYEFSDSVGYAEKCFLENFNSWPSAAQMKLDPSQYEAVKLALTNKLALIQGPPGTGKTFLGVKIIQLLLHNKTSWWNKEREKHKPILMICYTNHALDQFLEYCIKECNLTKGIVRVGGRSKAEYLEPFLLKNIKRDLKNRRQIDRTIYYQSRNEQRRVSDLRIKINSLSSRLSTIFNGDSLLSFDEIFSYIRDDHLQRLIEESSDEFKSTDSDNNYILLEWLGLLEIDRDENVISQFENLRADLDEGRIIVGQNDDRDEDDVDTPQDNIEIKKEVDNDDTDSLNEERMLETDFDAFENIKSKHISYETKVNTSIPGILDINAINRMIKTYKKNHGIAEGRWIIKTKDKQIEEDLDRLKYNLKNIFSFLRKKYTGEDIGLLESTSNIWRLSYPERFLLYFQWLNKYKSLKQIEIQALNDEYHTATSALQEIRLQEDRSIMEDAFIIAMTTTGSSRYHSILKDIGPRIVIVEEAAEVFEAHIVSSLSKHCEHLILIGDHVQLRPNPAVYNLATKYFIDVSLFERLINNDTKQVMLNNQHRMRPEISVLMEHFYGQKIQDDSSVFDYPNVHGVKKNVFFIEHSEMEKRLSNNTTKINPYEAQYLVKLCSYLVKQNYKESQITILTMYLGQMMEIRRLLKDRKLSSVKVWTVDNYQGEENDIIILSLVRSNPEGKIGFLNIKNRICVSLSRAKHGLFVIGNFKFITKNERSDFWARIIDTLRLRNMIGKGLWITCDSHPQNDIEIIKPEDFDSRPDGGCSLPCGYRLKCGHACSMRCHGNFDKDHKLFKCIKTCDKSIQKCGHLCKKICSSRHECTECSILVNKTIPDCGHVIKFRCDQEPTRANCLHPCKHIFECGHQCTKLCKDKECGKCLTKINVNSVCKHNQEISVYCSDPKWIYKTKCTKDCNQLLDCGHRCKSLCGKCFSGLIHDECSQKCNRLLFCGHKCTSLCSSQCQPCEKQCENQCEHSKCPNKCSQPCSQCKEPCKNSCKHTKCTKLCHELCNRKTCDEPCGKKLKCGHECIGLCGELCPKLCRICKSERVNELFFGTEEDPEARFIHLNDCGHLLEVSGLDYWINSRYGDENNNETESNTVQLPDCPKCKTPIRRCKRYAHVIKKQLKAIEVIKLKQFGDVKENEELKKGLLNEIKTSSVANTFDNRFIEGLVYSVDQEDLFFNTLASYKNTWNIFKNLKKVQTSLTEKGLDKFKEQKEFLDFEINKIFGLLMDGNDVNKFREGQRLNDVSTEIDRINFIIEFFRVKNLARLDTTVIDDPFEAAILLDELEGSLLEKVNKMDDKKKKKIENSLSRLGKLMRIEISKEEKLMIVKAMGLEQGQWFKCPNGHLYCIGDCGGAMERSKCPECKAEIGGEDHQVVRGNQLATDMNGAIRPAWPTALTYQ